MEVVALFHPIGEKKMKMIAFGHKSVPRKQYGFASLE